MSKKDEPMISLETLQKYTTPPENSMLEMLRDHAINSGDSALEEFSAAALRGDAKAMAGCKRILREALEKTLGERIPRMSDIVECAPMLSEQQKALGCEDCRHLQKTKSGRHFICTNWLGPQADAETGICIRRWLCVGR